MELGFEDRIVFVNNNYVKPFETPKFARNGNTEEDTVELMWVAAMFVPVMPIYSLVAANV